MRKIRVGIIGCGAIGSEIARACQSRFGRFMELAAICDLDPEKTLRLNNSLKYKAKILDLDPLIKKVDFVVEASGASISADIVKRCTASGKDCLIMSVGGLLGRESLLKRALSSGVKIYLPSGAVAGIDALKAAAVGKIQSVTLTTRKPLKGLEGAPYLKEKDINLKAIKKETVVFSGNALGAIKGFPQNINVSAVLSLSGIGARKTRVRIVTSPSYTKNIHEVEVRGDAGCVTTKTENIPSSSNPKTSALAIYSAIATLRGVCDSVRIGT